jgi:hypothetical protein
VNIPKNIESQAKRTNNNVHVNSSALIIDSLTKLTDQYKVMHDASVNDEIKKDSTINELKEDILKQQLLIKYLQTRISNYKSENIKSEQTNRILILFNSISGILLVLSLIWLLRSPSKKKPKPDMDYILVKRTEFAGPDSIQESNSIMEQKIERLERLGNLKESGTITEEEFNRQKLEIL